MKKILLFCVSMLLIFAMLPLTVFADTAYATQEELDAEIATIQYQDLTENIWFLYDGSTSKSPYWTCFTGNRSTYQRYQSAASCSVRTNYNVDAGYKANKTLDLTKGFSLRVCTWLNSGSVTTFDGGTHYIKVGSLKLVIDSGCNTVGSERTSGVYLYNGDVLVASADTGATAGDTAFESKYTASQTYYYIDYICGKYSVRVKNGTVDETVTWKLASDSSTTTEVPVTATGMSAAELELFKAKNVGNSAYDVIFSDMDLRSKFLFDSVSDFVNYIKSFDETSSATELTIARTLIESINTYGTTALQLAAVVPYEKTIKHYELLATTGLGDVDTSVRDSGNVPSSFFTKEKWTNVADDLIYEMEDGSLKFDKVANACFDSFKNQGLKFQFKAVYQWAITFRNSSATDSDGYVIGYNKDGMLYFKKAGSDSQPIARSEKAIATYKNADWNDFEIKFEDYEGKTVIKVYINGLSVNFQQYLYTDAIGTVTTDKGAYYKDFSTIAIVDGYIIDYAPKQFGNYINISQHTKDLVNGSATISVRSIDAEEKSHIKTITCVGDSITQGSCATSGRASYPAYLQRILGTQDYDVLNCGRAAAHLQSGGWAPYSRQTAYNISLASEADYVIFMLGTNDAQDALWTSDPEKKAAKFASFKSQMKTLIEEYQKVGSEVIVMTSPYCFYLENGEPFYKYIDDIVAIQIELAEEMGLDVIDLYSYSKTWGDDVYFYADGLHFYDYGYERVAQYIADYFYTRELDEDVKITTVDNSAKIEKIESEQAIDSFTTVGKTTSNDDIRFSSMGSNGSGYRGVIGGIGQQMGMFLDHKFNLGTNFTMAFTFTNSGTQTPGWQYYEGITPYDTLTDMYASVKLGALELRISNIKNSQGKNARVCELFINGEFLGSGLVDSGSSDVSSAMKYEVTFDNGNITVKGGVGSASTTLVTVTAAEYAKVRDTQGYTFNGVGFSVGTGMRGSWVKIEDITIKAVK